MCVFSIAACTPFDAYDYRVMFRNDAMIDGCDRVAWVGFSDTKEHGNERLANSIIQSLEGARWRVVTTESNYGNQRREDSAGSGARYLIFANTSQPQGFIYGDEPHREQRRVMTIGVTDASRPGWVIYIQADSYPSIFAKSLVRALNGITEGPVGSLCPEAHTVEPEADG